MTALELLEKVRELLSDRGKFCQGTLAVDVEGVAVDPLCPWACQWCLGGALELLGKNSPVVTRAYRELTRSAWFLFHMDDFESVNDRSYEDMLACLDHVIARRHAMTPP